jgi:hypothetical protein
MGADLDLFDDGDPFDDPVWQRAAAMAGALPRPGKEYVAFPLAWLARVLPVLRSSDRLAVAMLLYRRCLVQRSKTVGLPNGELAKLGIGRMTKYRVLLLLEEAGAITIETRNGRSLRVTLHWFP